MDGHMDRGQALLAIDKALVKLNPGEALDFLRRDLNHDDEELFALLNGLGEDRSAYEGKAKATKVLNSLRTLPGTADLE